MYTFILTRNLHVVVEHEPCRTRIVVGIYGSDPWNGYGFRILTERNPKAEDGLVFSKHRSRYRAAGPIRKPDITKLKSIREVEKEALPLPAAKKTRCISGTGSGMHCSASATH